MVDRIYAVDDKGRNLQIMNAKFAEQKSTVLKFSNNRFESIFIVAGALEKMQGQI